jgi:ABC-type antimicrobial peptide transport system permease subunit
VSTDTARRHLTKLDHTGPAFADSLFVVAAGAATVLAIGATVLGGLITARRRSYELAALEAVGVAPRSLRRATAAEQGLLRTVGVVLGVLAGIAGALLALPSTPFFVYTDVGPPVEYGLPGVTLAVLGATLVVVLAVTCALMARLIEGQATAARLREAQQ